MKHIKIDFKSKMIDIAGDMYGNDFKKKFKSSQSSDFDSSEESL